MKRKLLLLSLFLTACANGNDGSPKLSSDGVNAAGTGETYATSCIAVDEQTSEREYAVVSGQKMTFKYVSYNDKTCGAPFFTSAVEVSFSLGANSTAVAGAREIDMTFGKVLITPGTAQAAQILNGDSYCGITDWTANVVRDITGRTCDGELVGSGFKVYTIVRMDSASIQFGVPGDPGSATDESAPDKRPTSLDDYSYTRQ